MNITRRAFLLAAFSILVALIPANAQTKAHATAADPLAMLPASDVVLVVDHGRIWNEAIPRFFGNDSAHLSKLMSEVEQFKKKTGVDVRSISRIAIGVRFVNPAAMTKNLNKKDLAVVVIAQGDFDPGMIVTAMRRDMKERVREEQHGGQAIYTVNEPGKAAAQPDIEKVAVTVLDANTVALGDLVNVRATVDAKGSGARLSPELMALATRSGNALISLAGNVPPTLSASLAPKGSSGNADLDKTVNKFFETVASIKQMYLSAGMTPTGIEAQLGARLASTEQAQSLGDMLLGVRQQYGVFIQDKMIRDLVNNMQITAQGDELQLRAELPQTVIAMMLSNAKKTEVHVTAAPPSKATTTQTTTPAQQPKKKTRRSTRRKRA